MTSVVHTQTLLISSANPSNPSSDTPWSFGVTLSPDLVRCNARRGQRLRLTLKRLCARALWQWVPRPISFSVTLREPGGYTFHDVSLPAGNPCFDAVAKSIAAQVKPALGSFSCKHDCATMKLVFAYAPPANALLDLSIPYVQIAFPDALSQQLLGFGTSSGGVVAYSDGMTLTSKQPLSDLPFATVKVHVRGVNPAAYGQSGTNLVAGALVEPCSVLAAFHVDADPFALLDYRNVDRAFAMIVTDETIRSLRFEFTDWQDQPLTQLTDHFMYLEVETVQ